MKTCRKLSRNKKLKHEVENEYNYCLFYLFGFITLLSNDVQHKLLVNVVKMSRNKKLSFIFHLKNVRNESNGNRNKKQKA